MLSKQLESGPGNKICELIRIWILKYNMKLIQLLPSHHLKNLICSFLRIKFCLRIQEIYHLGKMDFEFKMAFLGKPVNTTVCVSPHWFSFHEMTCWVQMATIIDNLEVICKKSLVEKDWHDSHFGITLYGSIYLWVSRKM